jgi:hypothetical protein
MELEILNTIAGARTSESTELLPIKTTDGMATAVDGNANDGVKGSVSINEIVSRSDADVVKGGVAAKGKEGGNATEAVKAFVMARSIEVLKP